MIDVLLATYRPNPDWLTAQIDSIRAQADVETHLIVREDAAGDGAAANFSALLAQSSAPYVALSDQDDIWLPSKLSRLQAKMQELEAAYGKDVPLLVFCDSKLTDDELRPLPRTFLARQQVDVAAGLAFPRLLMQNFIAGHAMLFNAALRAKAGAVPPGAVLHDYWLALVASAFGHIGFVGEPLVWYRQHDANALGAVRPSRSADEFRGRLAANVAQAAAFVARFAAEAPETARVLADFPRMGGFARRAAIRRYGLWKHGFKRNLALYLFA